jgi:23S rRNA C2498 (ribose-2'-O)-methylase RlmM
MDIVEGLALSETKEETTNNSLRAMDVGALPTLGTFVCTDQRKMVMSVDRLTLY